MSDFLEAAMLAAFSVSWYCSIWKMLATGRASGKSLGFVVLICAGYVCGISAKISLYVETGTVSALILLYAWNLLVTAFDAFLVYHYGYRARRGPQHPLLDTLEQASRALNPKTAPDGPDARNASAPTTN